MIPQPGTTPELSERADFATERYIADLEGDAESASHACPDCTHPSCLRYKRNLEESRQALRNHIREIGGRTFTFTSHPQQYEGTCAPIDYFAGSVHLRGTGR